MANVIFKRGIQANLPANGSAQDGVFYLTTDTNRLYVGVNSNRVLLNQTVNIVANMNALNTLASGWSDTDKRSHENDFYYITSDNVLAVYLGKDIGWKQINPDDDTKVDEVSVAGTVSNNVATIAVTVDSVNEQTGATTSESGSIDISGSGTVKISETNDGLQILGETYSLGKSVSQDNNRRATIQLNSSDSNLSSSVTLVSNSSDLTFENSGDNILVKVNNSHLVNDSVDVSIPSAGTLEVEVLDSDGSGGTGSLSNVGIALNDGTYAPIVASAAGTSTGALYSKNEIDTMLEGLDGMTYKGTIGDSGATINALPTTNVKNGDTYVIVKRGWTASNFAGATFNSQTIAEMASGTRIGDMLIAKGTEQNGAITAATLEWTYIPAGNDALDAVTYSAVVNTSENSIKLQNANNAGIAKLVLSDVTNGDVVVTSAVSTTGNTDDTLTATIAHKTYSAVTPTAAATLSNGSTSFTAIKGITLSNGHVTAIETDTFTPVTYDLEGATATNNTSFTVATNSGTNDVDVEIGLVDSNNQSRASATFNLASSSIKLTAGNSGDVTMNIEWGSF